MNAFCVPNGGMTAFGGLNYDFDSTLMLTRLKMFLVEGTSGPGGMGDTLEEDEQTTTGTTRVYSNDHNDLRRAAVNEANGNDAIYYGYDGSNLLWQHRFDNSEPCPSRMMVYLWGPTEPVLEHSNNIVKGLTHDPQGARFPGTTITARRGLRSS